MNLQREKEIKEPDGAETELDSAAYLENPEDRKTLIRKIRQEYLKANGLIDWQRVWQDHPKWKAFLGADSKRGQARLYGLSAYVAKTGGGKHGRKHKRKRREPTPTLALVTQRPRYSDGVPFCPSCSFHIQPWNRAWNEMKNAA